MHAQTLHEHQWLEKLIGEWTFESECNMGPDRPPMKATGAEGPNFTDCSMVKYQDLIEFLSTDHRTLSSQTLGADGRWYPFMKAHYRRKK